VFEFVYSLKTTPSVRLVNQKNFTGIKVMIHAVAS
jgi:hypothetical protein